MKDLSQRGLGPRTIGHVSVSSCYPKQLSRTTKMSSLDLHSFCLVIASLVAYVSCFNPFEDTQYDISWGGPVTLRKGQVTPDGKDFLSSRESVVMITKDNEKYQCILPQEEPPKQNQYSSLGPDAELLLEPLVREGQCSYRQDLYWTYELCHGRHVRQFHAVKLDKQDITQQEYYLGKAEPKVLDRKRKESVRETSPSSISPPPLEGKETKVPTHKLDGHSFPYYKVEMENGTPCDLLGDKPRTTSVIYMCSPVSRNEILSVKEIQTCQYEVEVFTPLLCANDAYRYKEKPIHHITCHSVDGSPDEPRSFSELMEERTMDTFTLEGIQLDQEENSPPMNEEHRNMPAQPDVLLTRAFLRGEYCLVGGGSGWWQYEFCYGNYVMQFHEQSRGPRIDVILGKWDKEAHINWRKTKQSASTSFSDHYYSGGDVCDLTGKPRHVQVRLKCKQSVHLQEVAISLTEPHTCEYILKVESPIVCPLLEKMDEHGLFPTNV